MKPPHRARSLGSPSALSRAGSTTALTNRLDASSIVASWSSSLEPKWPKRPLLLISRSLARRPIVNPSRPSIDARSTARSRMAARVRLGWRPLPLLWAAVGVTVPILLACRTNVRALQCRRSAATRSKEGPVPNYAVKKIDDMEAIYLGAFKRARAELGISSFGMQVMDIPAGAEQYPEHDHSEDGQEEVYLALRGSAEIEI